MKINFNTVLLIALLLVVYWYLFIRKAPVLAVQPDSQGEPVIVEVPGPTTIVEKIVEVIKYRDRPTVSKKVATQSAAGNVVQSDFTPTYNYWKKRFV